jgi:uncharacterized protein (TIGR03083 family)
MTADPANDRANDPANDPTNDPANDPTNDPAALYDASRARVAALVENADPATPVAACPGWTVGALVAHLAGGLADFMSGRFDLPEGDDFGERTVRERRDQSIAESLAEWERHRADAGEMLGGPMGGVLVAEVISHEHDLRQALGKPGARDDAGVRAALVRPLQEIDNKLGEAGGPSVRLVIDGEQQVVGPGEPPATLRVTAFELLRVIAGRRTLEQVRALDWTGLDWDGDSEASLSAFTLFGGFRETALEE